MRWWAHICQIEALISMEINVVRRYEWTQYRYQFPLFAITPNLRPTATSPVESKAGSVFASHYFPLLPSLFLICSLITVSHHVTDVFCLPVPTLSPPPCLLISTLIYFQHIRCSFSCFDSILKRVCFFHSFIFFLLTFRSITDSVRKFILLTH